MRRVGHVAIDIGHDASTCIDTKLEVAASAEPGLGQRFPGVEHSEWNEGQAQASAAADGRPREQALSYNFV